MQPAGAGLETDQGEFRVVRVGFGAIPQAGAAVDAFFTVEYGSALVTGSDGLAGTHFHTDLAVAGFAVTRIEEHDVV
jgi:predicted porin